MTLKNFFLQFVIGLLIFGNPCNGQQDEDLRQQIKKLMDLSNDPLEPNDSIWVLAQELKKSSLQAGYERGVLEATYFTAHVYTKTERQDSAIILLESLLTQLNGVKSDSVSLKSRCIGLLGLTNHLRGNYQQALKYYLQARELFEERSEERNSLLMLYNIARLHRAMGNIDIAFDYYMDIYSQIDVLLDFEKARIFNALGTHYSGNNQLDSAGYFFQLALDVHKENNDQRGVSHGYNNLAIVAYQQGDTRKAIEGFEAALAVRLKLGNQANISDSYYNIGYLYADLGVHAKALEYFRQGLKHARLGKSLVAEKDLLIDMATSFKKSGQFDSAYLYLSDWRVLNDSLLKINKQKEILALEKEFQTEQLRKDAALAAKDSELKTSQRNVLLVSFGCFVLIAIIIFYGVKSRYRRSMALTEREKALAEKQSELTLKELELKQEEVANYTSQLVHKNEVLAEMKSRLEAHARENEGINKLDYDRMVENIAPNLHEEKNWIGFKIQFEKAYPEFLNKLLSKSVELSANDQRLAALIKVNLSNKEIGQVLNISSDSVAKAKYRLRQKMGFDHYTELENYILKA